MIAGVAGAPELGRVRRGWCCGDQPATPLGSVTVETTVHRSRGAAPRLLCQSFRRAQSMHQVGVALTAMMALVSATMLCAGGGAAQGAPRGLGEARGPVTSRAADPAASAAATAGARITVDDFDRYGRSDRAGDVASATRDSSVLWRNGGAGSRDGRSIDSCQGPANARQKSRDRRDSSDEAASECRVRARSNGRRY